MQESETARCSVCGIEKHPVEFSSSIEFDSLCMDCFKFPIDDTLSPISGSRWRFVLPRVIASMEDNSCQG